MVKPWQSSTTQFAGLDISWRNIFLHKVTLKYKLGCHTAMRHPGATQTTSPAMTVAWTFKS